MIYIILQAQLGNQLFQIFNVISLSLEYNVDYKILIDKEHNTIFTNNITYFNNFLNELSDKISVSDKSIIINNEKLCEEKYFHYNKIIINKENDIILKGLYQSHKYFLNHYDTIYKMLNIESKKQLVKNKYNAYFNKKTIAIHFRIADYYYLQNYHEILPINYYINALSKLINIISDDIKEYNILYFCQKCDNELATKYLSVFKNLNFIKVSDDIINYDQMMLMANCDNIIIANSTFSWFGAFFSDAENILYPNKWFGPANKNNSLKDLFPHKWIEII
jgi:hypothetical protein